MISLSFQLTWVHYVIWDVFVICVGEYWIDPNGGLNKDAVKVFCRMKSRETCFLPKTESYPVENLSDNNDSHSSHMWFAKLRGEKRVGFLFIIFLLYHFSINFNEFILLSNKKNWVVSLYTCYCKYVSESLWEYCKFSRFGHSVPLSYLRFVLCTNKH